MFSRTALGIVVLAWAVSAGCATARHIADIQSYPGRYYDRTVSIEGKVTSSFGGPFVPVQFYKVDDGTGEMTVIASGGRGVPRQGARVRVKGRVEELASFGDRSFGLHLREEGLTVAHR